ncbi:hypothetical protein [Bradyrhizobium sp. HKCCYLS20291]|uniref:hypothetical protein n=1 Tax=Bradyrhizobium sp. HKCCYLS20291 TaxID=3420766 RepID=UPI003EB89A28
MMRAVGLDIATTTVVMAGLDPPARPKPLRRGEGPAIHVHQRMPDDVDARHKAGHDDNCGSGS